MRPAVSVSGLFLAAACGKPAPSPASPDAATERYSGKVPESARVRIPLSVDAEYEDVEPAKPHPALVAKLAPVETYDPYPSWCRLEYITSDGTLDEATEQEFDGHGCVVRTTAPPVNVAPRDVRAS